MTCRHISLAGIVIATLLLLSANEAFGKGLSIEPAVIRWDNAAIGKNKCPEDITIINRSDAVRSYTLRTILPADFSEENTSAFEPLPNKNWISFSHKSVAVGPWQEKKVSLYAEIPDLPDWQDQKWEFLIEVAEYSEGGDVFALACYPRVYLKTRGGGQ